MEKLSNYLDRIRQIAPELVIRQATVNSDGLANDVVMVNDETVFRFAKNDYGRRSLQSELVVLEQIQGRMPLAVPEPFYSGPDVMAYPCLKGITLSRELFQSLPAPAQQVVTRQLAEFLHALVDTPSDNRLPQTQAPVTMEARRNLQARTVEKIYPLLMPHQRTWAEQLFRFLDDPTHFDYSPRLIHGDIGPYHLLFDPQAQRLSGVIDFGTSGLGDPANDIGLLMQIYGEGFIAFMRAVYSEIDQYLERARFYALTIELEWVLNGLESGENFWYTAHLGGARVIQMPKTE